MEKIKPNLIIAGQQKAVKSQNREKKALNFLHRAKLVLLESQAHGEYTLSIGCEVIMLVTGVQQIQALSFPNPALLWG